MARPSPRFAAAAAMVLTVFASAGCDTSANRRVTSMSIVALSMERNLIQNGGFERSLGLWTLRIKSSSWRIDARHRWSGRSSLELVAKPGRGRPQIILEQQIVGLPKRRPGSTYRLQFRVRTSGLNRSVQTELKLNFVGGGYRFVRGGPIARGGKRGIPPGTSRRWVSVRVEATAPAELSAIDAFVVDSGTKPLSGRIWIDGVHLRLVRRGRGRG
jgi:hypothetical protein